MRRHATDIIVHHVDGFTIDVTVDGELRKHIGQLSRHLENVEGVASTKLDEDQFTIVIEAGYPDSSEEWRQLRIRIRNGCRDWVHNVTGYLTNTGGLMGHFVDLVEDTKPVPAAT